MTANQRQFFLCLDERHTGLEARHNANGMWSAIAHVPCRVLTQWSKCIRLLSVQPETGGRDAHNGITLSVKNQRHTDRSGASAEPALPKAEAQDHHGRGAGPVFFGEEGAPLKIGPRSAVRGCRRRFRRTQPRFRNPQLTMFVAISFPDAYCCRSVPSLCVQRSRFSVPPKETMIASTCFVSVVTIVRSESLVALPCGPTVSAKSGNPSKFKPYFPIPLYVSPASPARKTISPTTCPRSYSPTGKRLSTETRLITSTTALICGKPFPANTHRSSASAEPRYLAGSFPSALYAARVAVTCGDSNTERGYGNFRIPVTRGFISSMSASGDAPASTRAVTQPSAVRGHFLSKRASMVICIGVLSQA